MEGYSTAGCTKVVFNMVECITGMCRKAVCTTVICIRVECSICSRAVFFFSRAFSVIQCCA